MPEPDFSFLDKFKQAPPKAPDFSFIDKYKAPAGGPVPGPVIKPAGGAPPGLAPSPGGEAPIKQVPMGPTPDLPPQRLSPLEASKHPMVSRAPKPVTPEGPVPGVGESLKQGAKEGFGSEPLVQSNQNNVVQFTDIVSMAQRGLNAGAGAVSELAGDTARRLGIASEGNANSLKRDFMQIIQSAGVASGMPEVPKVVASKPGMSMPKAAEAPATTHAPPLEGEILSPEKKSFDLDAAIRKSMEGQPGKIVEPTPGWDEPIKRMLERQGMRMSGQVKEPLPNEPKAPVVDLKTAQEPKPAPLGAAAPGQTPLPERPSRATIGEQADRFYKIGQEQQADKIELKQRITAIPKEVRNPAVDEKFYKHMEDPQGNPLKPEEQAIYDKHIAPLKKEERDLFDKATQYGIDLEDMDPNYVHRMPIGKSPSFDKYAQTGSTDPVVTSRSGGLPRKTASMFKRKYFSMEEVGQPSNRKLISLDDNGKMSVIKNKNFTPVTPKLTGLHDMEVKPGATVEVGGKQFKIGQARTHEIEADTSERYYKSGIANTANNVLKLRHVNRSLAEIKRLTESPEWGQYAKPHVQGMAPKEGFVVPKVPLFEKWEMDPKMAHVIEDFYKHREGTWDFLSKANNFAVRSLFWQPITHAVNVGVHWGVARGWDWLNPVRMVTGSMDALRAVKEVVTQGEKMQQMMRDGSAMISPSVENSPFYEQLLKRVGMDIEKNPDRWGPVIKALRLNGPADLVKTYYNGVSKVLWQANDVFMMQRVLELERKGMSGAKAIKETEKHIPNYRIPPEVLGRRDVQQILTNPLMTEFSRYHYGIFKSYAHMLHDTFGKGVSAKERFDGIGNMMALGAMGFYIYPMLDNAIQQAFDNPDARAMRRGAMTVPDNISRYYNEDIGLPQLLGQILTISPLVKTGIEQMSDLDLFTGKRIAEPGATMAEGAIQRAGHLAKNAFTPLQNLTGKGTKSAIQKALEQTLGISNPTEEQVRGKKAAQSYQKRNAAKRRLKPYGGFLE